MVIFGGRSVAVFGVSLWTDLVIKSMTISSLLCLEGRSPSAYQSNIEYAREGSHREAQCDFTLQVGLRLDASLELGFLIAMRR